MENEQEILRMRQRLQMLRREIAHLETSYNEKNGRLSRSMWKKWARFS